MITYKSFSRRIFEICNHFFFVVYSIIIILPFLNVISISFSSPQAIDRGQVGLFPVGFNVYAYIEIVNSAQFITSFANSVFVTFTFTILLISISLAAAYTIANKHTIGKIFMVNYLLVPMFFSGGLIPTYLIVTNLGMHNTYWALILPGLASSITVIIFRNAIDHMVPKELIESAEIDGAGHIILLFRIIFPVMLPIIATFTLFTAVGMWNEWFSTMIYITDPEKFTLQYTLRDLISFQSIQGSDDLSAAFSGKKIGNVNSRNLRMAALMVSIIPILFVYPFMQRYFIQGILVGAVKG